MKGKGFKYLRIKDLTSKTISKLILENNAGIPTLEEVLKFSLDRKVKKPIHIEIKSLNTDYARKKLIRIVSRYSKYLDISFIVFDKIFYKSFPYPPRWIQLFQKYNLKVYKIGRHEFTQKPFDDRPSSQVSVLLSETNFNIKNTEKRTVGFLVTLEDSIHLNSIIKIGIYHGADNTGDKGLYFKIKNLKENTTLMQGFSNGSRWQWFSFNYISDKPFKITIEDLDTRFDDKYPGNAGKIKVILIH